jgi:hypothetical protein
VKALLRAETRGVQPVDREAVRPDRTVFSISSLDGEDRDIAYWQSTTPEDRLRHMVLRRWTNDGRRAIGRARRVSMMIQRPLPERGGEARATPRD